MTEPDRAATPPRISRLILRLLLPGERFESIAGDLEESFADRAEEHGVRYARTRYRRDVADVIVRAPATWRRRGRRNEATSRAWPGLQELRYSLRRLAKQPSFTLTAVLTLALGTGATTAVVSVARTLLATPEAGDGRVVLIWGTRPVFNARRVDRLVSDSMAMRRLAEQVSGGTAIMAVAMTIVGIYGTLSYVVAQRRREIGLRLAIGAGRSDIVGLVIREGIRPAVVGLAVGIAAGSWVAALSRSYFFGISAFDPWTYTLAAALLITAVLAASSAPAWRASRVDPIIALEAD